MGSSFATRPTPGIIGLKRRKGARDSIRRISLVQEASMGYIKRTFMLYVTPWLMRRRWGRRLLFVWALRAMRSRVRQFLREIAKLYPVLKPAAAWV
jgi:hypothetical protein